MPEAASKRAAVRGYQGGQPTVSVIVPTHQRRELVRGAVDSVLAQSFRDFELIVIDDGSTDGTGEALEGIDPRLVYRWQENRGVSAARNAGIELAGGEIVAFLDSDNLWRREHLAIVCELLERSPEAVLASTCPRFALKGSETASDAVLRPWRDEVMPGARFAGFVSCFAVRRAALRRAGMFDEALSCGEDSDLVARLALLGPFATISRQTLVRRTSEGSLQSVSHATGSYLQVAERQAANLRTFAEQLDQPLRDRVVRQAEGLAGLAAAFQGLHAGDASAVRAGLAQGSHVLRMASKIDYPINRLRTHLPAGRDPAERFRALQLMLEGWPWPDGDMARFVRLSAIFAALRARRPRQAARWLASWPRGGNVAFARKTLPVLRDQIGRIRQERRYRLTEV